MAIAGRAQGALPNQPLDVAAIRKDFPIFETGIAYLDSANTSQRPKQVTGAMLEYFEKFNSNIHRAAYRIAEEATVRYEATREKVRAFINAASTKEIVYTRGTTEAINLVAYAWGRKYIGQGDLIVLTILDHHSNIVPWQILAAERGAHIEYVDIDEKGELRQDQFADLLQRGPKLVAFNLVSNAMGTINPARDMVAAAKKAGATVLVDGAQSTPHQPVDVRALGCDFYAFSGHKMLGPTGAGILYGRRELLEAMDPFMAGGDMIKTVRIEGTTYHDLPWKFEAGTQAIAEVIGLGAAVDYLSALGMDAVRAHELEITEYAYEALSDVEGLTLYGPPPSRRAGVVSFALEGIHPHDLATIADRDQVCLRAGHHCAMPLMTRLGVAATARASFYVYTQKEEVDRLVGSIKEAQRIFA
ncbi:MAG: cysteine desulfurase [Chloroflexi bacterium]|nr:MAG: cysteine desulfurase [Chloroflexota bacterium]